MPTRPSPVSIKHEVRRHFVEKWLGAINDQPKLRFYKLLKSTFAYEPYLDLANASWRKSISRLRCSSHTLNIETGRYIDQSNPSLRLWDFCNKTLQQDSSLQHQAIEDDQASGSFSYCMPSSSTTLNGQRSLKLRRANLAAEERSWVPELCWSPTSKVYIKVLPKTQGVEG